MSSSSSPCAACKLLRRKCTQGCVFAPYFPPDSPAKFASVHKVFGASNVSKILNELPQSQRGDAVSSLAFEADARLRDPVYGCVAYITVLQVRIKEARDELAAARKELAGYIGPAAFAPLVAAAAAAPPQYQHHQHQYAADVHLGVGVGAHQQQQMVQQIQQHHQQQMAEAQQLAAAVEVAREQAGMMMRQAYAPGGATVPHDVAAQYDGGFFLQQQQQQSACASQAQTAVALTYQMDSSPPPSSCGQSPAEEVSQQQHTDGSDEGSGGVALPAC